MEPLTTTEPLPPEPDGSELAHPLESPPAEPPPIVAAKPSTPDVSDRFPVGTCVDVYYPRDNKSWTGKVVHSFVYRPRVSGLPPERRIHVDYGEPHGIFEHGLNGSDVRKHGERSQRLKGTPLVASPRCDKVQKRIARIARQLA